MPLPAGIFAVVLHGGWGDGVLDIAVVLEEIGQLNIVTLGDALTNPLAVADDHIEGVALGCPFGRNTVIEGAPWLFHNVDFDAGLFFIHVADFLQVLGRIPLGPQDGQLFDAACSGSFSHHGSFGCYWRFGGYGRFGATGASVATGAGASVSNGGG